MTRTRSLIALLTLGAAGVAGCGNDDPSEPIVSGTGAGSGNAVQADLVEIERSRFAPDQIKTTVGTEVTFENLDPFAHTVTSADSPSDFDSGELRQDDTFVQVFDDPGTYAYFCEIHPTMRAEVVVTQ